MSKVRVLVGTRKGAFVPTSDGKRDRWASVVPTLWGCRCTTASRVRPSTRIVCTRRSTAVGSGK
jgi:hypothetical protein